MAIGECPKNIFSKDMQGIYFWLLALSRLIVNVAVVEACMLNFSTPMHPIAPIASCILTSQRVRLVAFDAFWNVWSIRIDGAYNSLSMRVFLWTPSGSERT